MQSLDGRFWNPAPQKICLEQAVARREAFVEKNGEIWICMELCAGGSTSVCLIPHLQCFHPCIFSTFVQFQFSMKSAHASRYFQSYRTQIQYTLIYYGLDLFQFWVERFWPTPQKWLFGSVCSCIMSVSVEKMLPQNRRFKHMLFAGRLFGIPYAPFGS